MNIIVLTNPPPKVTILAPNNVAVEGTNYYANTNTVSFTIRRDGPTNAPLPPSLAPSTAEPRTVWIMLPSLIPSPSPAGKSYAIITIVPLNDDDSDPRSL